jgi:hypothetical protein
MLNPIPALLRRVLQRQSALLCPNPADFLPLVPASLLAQITSSPSPTSKSKQTTFRLPLATKISPQRQVLVKALCKSYIRLADVVKSYKNQIEKWCEELLTLDGRKEEKTGGPSRSVDRKGGIWGGCEDIGKGI